MESGTVTLILGALVVLVVINYLFLEEESGTGRSRSSRPVPVTNEMIESVRAIAPGLTTVQIRADLQETGSVQGTVDRYLSGALVVADEPHNNNGNDGGSNLESINKKSTSSNTEYISPDVKKNVSGDGPFNGLSFEGRKRQMIMENREKLAKKRGCSYILT